jgi:uncharacterized protein (TIRG00374 family)
LSSAGARLSPWAAIGIYYRGWLVGAFLPTHLGGDLLRAHLVATRTGVVHPAYASLVMEKAIGFLSAINWAIVGGVVVGCALAPVFWGLWVGLGFVAALGVNGLFLLSLHPAVHARVLGWLGRHERLRLLGLARKLYDAYADFSRRPDVLVANFLLTVVEHGLQLLILFTIAAGLGVDVSAVLFFAAAAVQTFVLRIPITPDGWGTAELAAVGVFGAIGIPAATAFTISVLNRFLGVAAVLPGFMLFLVVPTEAAQRPVFSRQHGEWLGDLAGFGRRLPMYLGGCLAFALGVRLFIDAGMGVDPFHAMLIGLLRTFEGPYLHIGVMAGAVTAVLLLVWVVWNRRPPPLGTFVTMVLIGGLADFWAWFHPERFTDTLPSPALLVLAGTMFAAYGSALIIMSGIGLRVVDLLALTFVDRLGWRFYRVRLGLEAAFLLAAFVLGGPVGIAALAFAAVGPFVEPFIWANRRFLNLPDHGLAPIVSPSRTAVPAARAA